MARNEEKAQLMLNRFIALKRGGAARKVLFEEEEDVIEEERRKREVREKRNDKDFLSWKLNIFYPYAIVVFV
ncbi:hypothetical protein Goklo_028550 [Gossypium klotzschianum]|uniref:Uncharacterized protein n=1 Tax=Gossypium klotzschianum TaxID=34286 RepID=A0A7J8U1U7_9ROSI|nr:hypothetical protein [Gossypium klotzschianum]